MPMLKRYNNAPQADIRIAIIEKEPVKNKQPFIFWRIMGTTMEILKAWCEYIDDEDAPFQISDYDYAGAFPEGTTKAVEWIEKLPDNIRKSINKFYISSQISILNGERFFWNFTNLREIIGIENIDFSKCSNLISMFFGCENMQKIDCSNILIDPETQRIDSMFENCYILDHIYIDLKKWNKSSEIGWKISPFIDAGKDSSKSVVANNEKYSDHPDFFYKIVDKSILYGCFEPKNFYTVADTTFQLLREQLNNENVFYYDRAASEENPDIIVVHPVKDKTLYITTKNENITIDDILL